MNFFTKLCRLCTSYEDVTLTLNHSDSDKITFLNKLRVIAPEILKPPNFQLPNGICKACIVHLNDAFKFRKTCFISQEILKHNLKQLQNKQVKNPKILKHNLKQLQNKQVKNPQICENSEINFEKVTITNANKQINCDNLKQELNLVNTENVDEYKNSNTFEFVNLDRLQNDRLLQNCNELEIEENLIKLEENIALPIKEEQIDDNSEINLCNTEKESNYFCEKNNIDDSKAIQLDCETDTIIKSENNLDFDEESRNGITNKSFSENSKNNENVELGEISYISKLPNSHCVYRNCTKRERYDKGISFFQFPKSNTELAKKWVENSGNHKLAELNNDELYKLKLCECHFKPEFILVAASKVRKVLVRHAVPYHYLTTNSTQLIDNNDKKLTSEVREILVKHSVPYQPHHVTRSQLIDKNDKFELKLPIKRTYSGQKVNKSNSFDMTLYEDL